MFISAIMDTVERSMITLQICIESSHLLYNLNLSMHYLLIFSYLLREKNERPCSIFALRFINFIDRCKFRENSFFFAPGSLFSIYRIWPKCHHNHIIAKTITNICVYPICIWFSHTQKDCLESEQTEIRIWV